MVKDFNPALSVERLAAYLDNNLLNSDMMDVATTIGSDEDLCSIIEELNVCDPEYVDASESSVFINFDDVEIPQILPSIESGLGDSMNSYGVSIDDFVHVIADGSFVVPEDKEPESDILNDSDTTTQDNSYSCEDDGSADESTSDEAEDGDASFEDVSVEE